MFCLARPTPIGLVVQAEVTTGFPLVMALLAPTHRVIDRLFLGAIELTTSALLWQRQYDVLLSGRWYWRKSNPSAGKRIPPLAEDD